MGSVRSKNILLKILLLIVVILGISLFVNSCTMLNSYPKYFSVVNSSYLSNDGLYLLQFAEETGSLKNRETSISVTFDYYYDSGIIIGNYTETITTEDGQEVVEQELVFAYVQEEILYSQNLNLLFKII